MLSDRVNTIKPSPTLSISAKAGELMAQGVDVVNLSTGEPDFDTPDFIKQAAMDAIQQGFTKYTAVEGILPLRQAICDKLKTENELSYAPDQIVVGTGGKQVIFNALMATLNEGDEVIIPSPYWVSYPDMTVLFGGKPVFVECPESNHFKMTADQLEKAITPKTKWLILNSPSNPTGQVYGFEELKALAEVLKRHPHVMVISDDIYEYLVYGDMTFYNIAQVEPSLIDRTLIVNGMSKAYAMTGWRIGYGAGPKELIKAITKLQSQSTSNPCSITQKAALGALKGSKDFLPPWKEAYIRRRDQAWAIFNASKGISCQKPDGSFYLYINCEQTIGKKTPQGQTLQNDLDVAAFLLDHAKVAVVPGAAFGLSPYFRISYATSDELLKKGCERIQQALALLTD